MLSVVMLSFIMLNIVKMSAVMLSVITMSVITVSVVMLSIILLNIVTLNVVMLSVVMLSVVAPRKCVEQHLGWRNVSRSNGSRPKVVEPIFHPIIQREIETGNSRACTIKLFTSVLHVLT